MSKSAQARLSERDIDLIVPYRENSKRRKHEGDTNLWRKSRRWIIERSGVEWETWTDLTNGASWVSIPEVVVNWILDLLAVAIGSVVARSAPRDDD
ncbi:MAG TPA: hypothetical protein VIJ38_08465 [Acidobacteriaceae bacterium]